MLLRIFSFVLFILVISSTARADKAEFSQWNFKLSGEERLRTEYKHDFDYNQSAKDNGKQFYHRLRLGVAANLTDEYLKPKIDLYVEWLDARTGNHRLKNVPTQNDEFDLHQAFVNFHNIAGSTFDVKAGRQEFNYGKKRLLGAPTWSNRMRVFDGGVVHYQQGSFWADLLYGQDMKYIEDQPNTSRSEEFITGIYSAYQKNKMAPLFEPYFLYMKDIKGASDINRYTVGARLQMYIAEGTVLDIEAPYQFGHTGSATSQKKEIKAYAYHVDITKSWEGLKWKPKFTVAYDEASGDRDPGDGNNNTFIPLYQSTHEPYGQLDFFRWQNVRNPEISLTFSPTDKLKFIPQADFFWLNSKFDSWYNSSGTVVRSKVSGERGYYVGTEVSLRAYYALNKYINIESGYAHFFTGDYIRDSGADDDTDWFYSQVALKF